MAQQMATAAYVGEASENSGTSRAALPAQVHQVRGQRSPGLCGSRALPLRSRAARATRSAVARYGLATEVEAASECTSDEVLRKVQQVADSQGALPEQARDVRSCQGAFRAFGKCRVFGLG